MQSIVEPFTHCAPDLQGISHLVHPLGKETWNRHAPTAHYALLRDDQLCARCSIWTESTPNYLGKPAGIVGHYASVDSSAGAAILNHAVEQLCLRGFKSAIGPMDGSTWRHYRLMTRRGSEPPFFLEPDNPDDWPDHFSAAGFVPLAHYVSGLNPDLTLEDPRVPEAIKRLENTGTRIRQIDPNRFEEELKAVHELSTDSFAKNFLYTPISQAEFIAMYSPIQAHLRPELVLLAEKDSQLVGFIFGMPDLMQARRGEQITTAIAKSLAVRPGRTGAGLGSVLLDQFQQQARRRGFSRVIHALMHQDNISRRLSSRFGQSFRQYTLYSREIGS